MEKMFSMGLFQSGDKGPFKDKNFFWMPDDLR